MGTSKPQGHPLPSEWSFFCLQVISPFPCIEQMSNANRWSSHFRIRYFHIFSILFTQIIHIFPLLSTLYSSTGIFNKWKISKNSRKQQISYLLKNHCFSHFFHLFGIFPKFPKITNFHKNLKNTIFHHFPIR